MDVARTYTYTSSREQPQKSRSSEDPPELMKGELKGLTSSEASSANQTTTSNRKIAHAVDPYLVERSVSGMSAVNSHSRYKNNTRQIQSSDSGLSVSASVASSWHEERLEKSFQNSDAYQKRLEDQATDAIRKAEEKAAQTYEKKIQNCLNTLDVVKKRKKNDLRLIELRKRTEIEKYKQRFEKEMFEEEMQQLKELQQSLKKQVLDMKAQNTSLREKCRALAIQNKQLLADKESNEAVQKEVAQYGEIRAQLETIKNVFRESHEAAAADLKRLERDCQKEAMEKMKLKNWIASLIKLMEDRCRQSGLVERIRGIDARAKEQRELVIQLRREKKNSSKQSVRSGTTTVLNRKVEDMRKRAGEKRILDDQARSRYGRKTGSSRREVDDIIVEMHEIDLSNSMIEEEDEEEDDDDDDFEVEVPPNEIYVE